MRKCVWKSCLLVAVALAGQVCMAQAQFLPQRPKRLVRLANEDGRNIQVKKILANPKIVSGRLSCEVSRFTVTFRPEWGGGYGPVTVKGSSLGKAELAYLEKMSDTNVKITIEDIHLNCNGKDETEEPITVTSFP